MSEPSNHTTLARVSQAIFGCPENASREDIARAAILATLDAIREPTAYRHSWYGPCDILRPDGGCVECAKQATLKEVYKAVVWGTDYDAVPLEEAMRRPRHTHLRQVTLERTEAVLEAARAGR